MIDYKKENLWDVIGNNTLDVVYDNFGAAGYSDQAMSKLRPGGFLVMIQGDLAKYPKPGVTQKKILLKVFAHKARRNVCFVFGVVCVCVCA